MNNNLKKYLLIPALITLFFIYYHSFIKADDTLVSRLQGKILLQVEKNGEAWYVSPLTNERYYMGRPQDAFNLMKNLGIGISNDDIKKISIAKISFAGADTDQDGLSDLLEDALGTDKNNKDSDHDGFDDQTEILKEFNPKGEGKLPIDNEFAKKQAGHILIQAEQNGEAWYVNPSNNKRYFLGRPSDAFNIMRQTGLGITNTDLKKIAIYTPSNNNDTNNTVVTAGNKRKFTDSNNNFSFEYPKSWKKTTIHGKKDVIFIRDYTDDIVKEKKAMISISFIKTNKNLDLNKFKTTSKKSGIKKNSTIKEINNYKTLKETFSFNKVGSEETTAFVQLDNQKMLVVTLFSAGNHNHYDSILGELLRSIEYTK